MNPVQKLLTDTPTVETAETQAREAKARLDATILEVRQRFSRQSLTDEAVKLARGRSLQLAAGAVKLAGKRPRVAAAGIVGVILFLARKPIARSLRPLLRRNRDAPAADTARPGQE